MKHGGWSYFIAEWVQCVLVGTSDSLTPNLGLSTV